jgi:hypothetical protein
MAMSLGVVHCDKSAAPPPPAKLGEPVGVRVDDVKDPSGKKLGSLQAAFAISEGTAAEPLVPGMARVLARIGAKCPALLAKGSDPLHLRGKTSAGKLKFAPAVPAESAESRCFRDAMDGERISESPLEVDIAIELRPESGT